MARLLAVCVVLLGLFLMHGSPASAAGGCHGAMAGSMAGSMPGAHGAPAVSGSHAEAFPTGHRADSSPPTSSAAAGTLCVSTPAHPSPSLPALGAPAAVDLGACGALGCGLLTAAVTRWRGPPRDGRGVLLRVCVTRT
ncbi:hypothetical protein SL103_22430 [Streptomyces lydicus]|uniref:Uncharacterized protein n=1 Tax=Streptomyces lydicus TaxID=47763 RepID=A0A1D7VPI8_9ACTN|nr:hypothetical protein SL103_22430 [Streptomyces lydicus]